MQVVQITFYDLFDFSVCSVNSVVNPNYPR